jgi:hypothetical protein
MTAEGFEPSFDAMVGAGRAGRDGSKEAHMALESLTFKEIKARPVICKLTRPAVARIGAMTHIPIILIDLFTKRALSAGATSNPTCRKP